MKKKTILLICLTAVIILVATMSRLAEIYLPDNNSRLFVKEGWLYRWGTSPVDKEGHPLWAQDDFHEGWSPMLFAGQPPGRDGQDTLWLKVQLPAGQYENPALYLKFVRQNFILYHNNKVIYRHGELPAPHTERYQPWLPAYLVMLPDHFNGGTVVFQISSPFNSIGIHSPVELASLHTLLRNKLNDDLFKILNGVIMLFLGSGAFILYLRIRESGYGYFCGYVLMVALLNVSSAFAKDFFYDAPSVWTGLIVFASGALQIFWQGFLQIFASVERRRHVRRVMQATIAVLGSIYVLFIYNATFMPLVIGVAFLIALTNYLLMWWVLLPIVSHNLSAQLFAAGTTVWILFYLSDAVILQFFPQAHHLHIYYGQFVEAVALTGILVLRFVSVKKANREYLEEVAQKNTQLQQMQNQLQQWNAALEETVAARTAELRVITESAKDAIIMMDPQGRISFWNPAAEDILGYKQEEALGQNLHRLLAPPRYHADHDTAYGYYLKTGHGNAVGKTLELEACHKDGHEIPVELALSAVQAQDGWHAVGIMRDITERKRLESEIRHLATHDALTGLPTRRLIDERFTMTFSIARRYKTKMAVMFLDLDGFKAINDNHGHDFGDAILQHVAVQLRSSIRETDTVGRIGGDEFLVIAGEIYTRDDAEQIANKIIPAINTPFVLNGLEVSVGVSIGIALYPDDGDNISHLIKQADRAMYEAKKSGKNGYGFAGNVFVDKRLLV